MTESIQGLTKNFKQNGFCIIREFLPLFFIEYLKEYFNILKNSKKLQQGDAQVPNSLITYGDAAFDTVLLLSTSIIEKVIDEELLPCYTYGRLYLNNATLLPHVDRKACEISATLSLGGIYNNIWPIYIENNNVYKANLNPGDILIYKGSELKHWRDSFQGKFQYQLFFHWVRKNGEFSNKIYDTRPYLGMPSVTKSDYGH